jgi:hypothetical protein
LSVESPVSDSLRKRIQASIDAVPAGKKGQFVLDATFVNGRAGAEVSFAQRITPVWSVGAWGALASGGQREIGIRGVATW